MVLPLLLKPLQVNCIRIATFIETDIRIRPVGPLRCSQEPDYTSFNSLGAKRLLHALSGNTRNGTHYSNGALNRT